MKILQINASYKPAYIYGGPTMSVSKLSEQLAAAGMDIQVFTTTANGDIELNVVPNKKINVDGVAVTYFSRIIKGHIHFSPKLLLVVWRQCRAFDVVHIHAWWNTVSVLTGLIAVIRGVKVVVSPRGTLSAYSFVHRNSFYKKAIHQLLTKPIFKRCAVHATSSHEITALKQIINVGTTHVIPNFVAIRSNIPNIKPTSGNRINLLFLSRIDPKKGTDILIQALSHIKRPYHLTITGDGEQTYIDTLKYKAKQLGISAHITWTGFQNEEKFSTLADHDLMVLPSQDENFGNVVIESLSVGTSVMISPHVGLADYVTDKNLGWIVDNDALVISAMIDSIQQYELNNIRLKAPAIIRQDFDEQNLTREYINMYKQIING